MKRPILFANITIELNIRGKKWGDPVEIKKVIVAGSDEEIKNDNILKKNLIKRIGKKIEIDKIRIIKIEKIHEMGLGAYHDNKYR